MRVKGGHDGPSDRPSRTCAPGGPSVKLRRGAHRGRAPLRRHLEEAFTRAMLWWVALTLLGLAIAIVHLTALQARSAGTERHLSEMTAFGRYGRLK